MIGTIKVDEFGRDRKNLRHSLVVVAQEPSKGLIEHGVSGKFHTIEVEDIACLQNAEIKGRLCQTRQCCPIKLNPLPKYPIIEFYAALAPSAFLIDGINLPIAVIIVRGGIAWIIANLEPDIRLGQIQTLGMG